MDLVLNDQRRAFSEEYVNFELLCCGCYIEIAKRNPISKLEAVDISELSHTSCILISSKEQQNVEEEYYQNTLGFSGNFLFAENLEEGRLMMGEYIIYYRGKVVGGIYDDRFLVKPTKSAKALMPNADMVGAYRYKETHIPIIGDIAEKMSRKK